MMKQLVRIACASVLLTVPAMAQNAAQPPVRNEISAGAAYSNLRGAVTLFGMEGQDLGGTGVDVSAVLQTGRTGQGGSAKVRYGHDLETDALGQGAKVFFGAEYFGTDWDDEAYQNDGRRLSVELAARAYEGFSYEAQMFWQLDRLSDLGANASPIVTAEEGQSTTAGLALTGHWGHLQGGVLPTSGAGLDVGASWAGLGSRKTISGFVAATVAQPVVADTTMVLRAEAGRIHGVDGEEVSILDHAFLGASGGPRGFAFGSVGPRDYVAGSVDTPLGGRRYSVVSSELRADLVENFSIGLFADAGAVWDLGDAVVVGKSGAIDDSRKFRASGGLSFYWQTPLGKLNVLMAKPLHIEDQDQFNHVSLGLMSSF